MAVLAVVLDGVFALVQRRVVSPGLTGRRVGGRGKDSRSVAVEADRPPADVPHARCSCCDPFCPFPYPYA